MSEVYFTPNKHTGFTFPCTKLMNPELSLLSRSVKWLKFVDNFSDGSI